VKKLCLIIFFFNFYFISNTESKVWKSSPIFGFFYETPKGWSYTEKFGWVYPEKSISDDQVWFYIPSIKWCWMNIDLGHYFYQNAFQCWSYVNNQNLFYDFNFGKYFTPHQYLNENWRLRLYTPTQITKTNHGYFIVDCWHHRILFSKENHENILNWEVIDENVAGPHSLIGIKNKIIYEDTGRGNLVVKNFSGDDFSDTTVINNIGNRPHRVIYDEDKKLSLVLNSGSRTLSILDFEKEEKRLINTLHLEFLEGSYSRSISLIDSFLYFTSGPNAIFKTTYSKDSIEVIKEYPVPEGFESMNDIFKSSNGWLYFTSSSNSKIVRSKSFVNFSSGNYQDLTLKLGVKGTPYYLSEFDDRIYFTEITESSGVIWFKDTPSDQILEKGKKMDFGEPNNQNILRRSQFPL